MPQDGLTPGRTTTITFDVPDFSRAQQPFWRSLQDLEITGNAVRPLTENVHFVHGIGFQLETIHDQMQFVHEENAAAGLRQDLSTALAAFASAPIKGIFSKTGLPVGSQVAGDEFNQKQAGAGDDWSSIAFILTTDQSAFPPPSETEIGPLDRVFLGADAMRPDQIIALRFWVPELGGGASIGIVSRIYFTGLASTPIGEDEGVGAYALSLRADGKAVLQEQSTAGDWVFRKNFRWSPSHQVSMGWHMLMIRSDAYMGDDGLWHGGVINFECQASQDTAYAGFKNGVGFIVGNSTTQYAVPQSKPQHITQHPPRLDVRRDVRMKISLSYTKFVSSGVLQTQTFDVPQTMGAVDGFDPPIEVVLTGSMSAGTNVDIALYGADGTACSPVSDPGTFGATSEQTWKSFHRLTKEDGTSQQRYYALLTCNASDDLAQAPIVREVDFLRQAAISSGASVPWTLPPNAATDYSILGPGMDPTVETASIGLISMQDGFTLEAQGVDDPLAPLSTRSGQSCLIEANIPETTINGLTATTMSLFIGKMATLRRKRLGVKKWLPGGGLQDFPSHTWWQGKAILNGLWKRLLQGKTTQTWNFGQIDRDTGQIYQITKIISLLLGNMGLPPNMLDIPDIPITLQADLNDKQRAFQIEVFSEAFAFALQLASDYLGAGIVIDANASNGGGAGDKYGCVRLKMPPRPAADGTFSPVCVFVNDATWNDGSVRGKLNVNSYDPYTRPSDGRAVPVCPVLGWTIENWDELPEGNCVYVTGASPAVSGGSLQAVSGRFSAIIHNWPAAKFFDGQPIACDPTHVDYTDGSPNLIVVIDPGLNTQGAVNIAARRTFDLSCHRREYMRLEAPVVGVIGNDPLTGTGIDPLQIRPRPLAWGDCVLYNSKYWFVSSVIIDVNGERGGTRNGAAVYELFRIPSLLEIRDDQDSVYQQYQLYGPVASAA